MILLYMTIGGVPFKIIDTAGIRDTNDTVEKIGVKKAIDIANKSDLIIAIFDITREINDEDRNILQILKNKNSIILLNKIDLNDQKVEDKIFYEYSKNIVKISTKTQDGFEDLIKIMQKLTEMEEINIDGENIIINSRHRALIVRAEESLKKAKETLENGMPIDVISIYIKEILEELGKITGESVTDDVISEIFSKFCLGK